MAHAYYKPLVEALTKAGFEMLRPPKRGSHRVFWNPETGQKVTTTEKLDDRHLANKLLKCAGITDCRL